ncbi:metal ABC transporter permease [Ruoffia tabacinasalis]|uniref:Metal ABC transporter permease n=1 Tax=Ruoffia tabacinasalis TaxID=87458 RepID=A0A5R9DWZ1_9LACT|nr:metal ABC transporter permease [Ruoffia tabacinasalis]MBG9977691.1 metal ABC transporter permease [Ruoffia tabacinasalis]TLQ41675.1 metal ABC transporter permease [Ruoffia tabacinasalis]
MELLQYDFIQRALIAGVAISFITPIIGLLLILRRQSLLADTLSHISLAGVALGMFLQVDPTLSTLLFVVGASIIIEYLRTIYNTFSEISVAIMMSAGMAIALVLVSLNSNSGNFQIDQYLFGSILLISPSEVKILVGLSITIVIFYLIFRRTLYVMSYDEATAYTSGLPVRLISIIFSVFTGVAISIMMPIVGALLVSALVVIPSATAIKISDSFGKSIVIGIIINLIGIFAGIFASYEYDTPPGASITLAFIVIFVIVSLATYFVTLRKRKQNNPS